MSATKNTQFQFLPHIFRPHIFREYNFDCNLSVGGGGLNGNVCSLVPTCNKLLNKSISFPHLYFYFPWKNIHECTCLPRKIIIKMWKLKTGKNSFYIDLFSFLLNFYM